MYYCDRLKQELFSKVNTLITCQSKTEKKAPSERVNTWYTSTLNFSFCTCVSLAYIVYLNQHSVYVAKQNKTNYLVNLGCSQLLPSISQRQPKETPFLPISLKTRLVCVFVLRKVYVKLSNGKIKTYLKQRTNRQVDRPKTKLTCWWSDCR